MLLLQDQTKQEVESGLSPAESDGGGVVSGGLFQTVQRRLVVLTPQRSPCEDVMKEVSGTSSREKV